MSDQAFADAARPAPRAILRLPMLEYSLGHELLLLQQRNPLLAPLEDFLQLELVEQRAAVIRAALICSRTWKANKKPHRWLKVWDWTIRRENFALAIAEFRIYREQGSLFPRMADPSLSGKKEEGRAMGSPFMARLTSFALKRFPGTAFDEPLGRLQFLYFSDCELEGACMVENASERRVREEVAGHQRKFEEEIAERQRAQRSAQPISSSGQLATPGAGETPALPGEEECRH